jgi:hypothetical protein
VHDQLEERKKAAGQLRDRLRVLAADAKDELRFMHPRQARLSTSRSTW